jgi:hypothetical protein
MDLLANERVPIPTPVLDYVIRSLRIRYLPNYRQPQTLHEKLIALATEIPDPRRTTLADKLLAKLYVQEIAPEVHVAKVLQVVREPEEFDLAALPEVAVLKSNNSCHEIRVLQAPYDREEIGRVVKAWRAERKPEWQNRIEAHYLAIDPRLFFEEYIGDDPRVRIDDYRFYVFHGQVRFMNFVIRHPQRPRERFTVDRSWQPLSVPRYDGKLRRYRQSDPARLPSEPVYFKAMVEAAERLASGLPFVRLDLYYQRNTIYFGEFTFTPFATFVGYPREWDLRIGAYLDLDRARREIRT